MMKSLSTVTGALCAFVALTNAQIQDIPGFLAGLGPAPITDPRFSNWTPPGKGDVRSPCPGLNSLANHGFLNHNGMNITIPQLITGGASGLNVGPDFMAIVGAAGLLSSPNPAGGSFDLNNLDEHNFPIEHDVSISRKDAYFGNYVRFNNKVWKGTLSYFKGLNATTFPTAAAARYARVKNTLRRNPEHVYGPKTFLFSSGETGLYVQTMSSPLVNSAPISFVRSLFELERLPVSLGWTPSTIPITFPSLGNFIVELFAVSPDPVAEGQAVLADGYAELFVNLVGGASALSNLTGGISDYLNFPGHTALT